MLLLHLNLHAAYLFKRMQLIKGVEILQMMEGEMRANIRPIKSICIYARNNE